jgi:hypothetical protein
MSSVDLFPIPCCISKHYIYKIIFLKNTSTSVLYLKKVYYCDEFQALNNTAETQYIQYF